jgi:hypothetical protein
MPKKITKKRLAAFFIITIALAHMPTQTNWHKHIAEHPVVYALITSTTACIIGKLSYDFYHMHLLSQKTIIESCRTTYEDIEKELELCFKTYHTDAHMSDWDLKEAIVHNDHNEYPFLRYHQSIVNTLKKVTLNYIAIEYELKRVNQHKNKLIMIYNNNIMRSFTELEQEGKKIKEQIMRIKKLLLLIKNKIELFDEYQYDLKNYYKFKLL